MALLRIGHKLMMMMHQNFISKPIIQFLPLIAMGHLQNSNFLSAYLMVLWSRIRRKIRLTDIEKLTSVREILLLVHIKSDQTERLINKSDVNEVTLTG